MAHLLADDLKLHQWININAESEVSIIIEDKVVDNIFIIIFSCLGFIVLLSIYMMMTIWNDQASIKMESLFHIKCHKILDYHKVEVVVGTADSILIETHFVDFIVLEELKILMFVINGENDTSKDRYFSKSL